MSSTTTIGLKKPYNQFSEHDELKLAELASQAQGDIIEIGCWLGHSTSILAKRCKDIGTRLFVIDNFRGNAGTGLAFYAVENDIKSMFIENMNALDLWENIVLIESDSDDAADLVPNADMIFIDAGHTYKQVLSDLMNYKNKARIICGHDYESETYDELHIEEDYVNGKHHGVIKAVNEVFGKVNHEGRMWWV